MLALDCYKFCVTKVECLSDIATVISHSAAMNYAQVVGDRSDHVIVPSYDWITFFDN